MELFRLLAREIIYFDANPFTFVLSNSYNYNYNYNSYYNHNRQLLHKESNGGISSGSSSSSSSSSSGAEIAKGSSAYDDEDLILQQRLANHVIRTIEFLWVFGLFSIVFAGLSFLVYQKPYDTPQGNTIVSKIRRIPFLGWFFRQPSYALRAVTDNNTTETEMEPLTKSDIQIITKKDVDKTVEEKHPGPKQSKRSGGDMPSTIKPGAYLVFNSPHLTLLCCGVLLLVAYLIWGFFQERIMAHPYGDPNDEKNWFKSSEFLVLVNRAFGLLVSSIVIRYTKGSGFDCPPYYYGLSALSNMSSSWLQYESLHYVTFPVQTVFKSAKVLVTMFVSTLMGKKHTWDQYLSATLVGVGVYLFLMSQKEESEESDLGWYFYLGLLLVSGYALTDAFTSNWQQKVFNETKVSSFEMMQGTNAVTFVVSLIFALPSIPEILEFYIAHPLLISHSLMVGLSAGFGQILIYYTVENFGAVKLATVMTSRMVVSVLLSIIYYGHPVSMAGVAGMVMTFGALFYGILSK